MASRLLCWFDKEKRDLPWRHNRDFYRVLVSEFMLQQTQVSTVIPYYLAFLERWPELPSLALATEDELRSSWSGLGYYRRAEHLRRSAILLAASQKEDFPRCAADLKKLPGIGDYTAAAIAAIVWNEKVAAVDGNIFRVLARLRAKAWTQGQSGDRKEAETECLTYMPAARAGDFTEAMMDLGAGICTPLSPSCSRCPLESICLAEKRGIQGQLPLRPEKKAKNRVEKKYLLLRHGNAVALLRREEELLHGFYEYLPLEHGDDRLTAALLPSPPQKIASFRHVFSHRVWEVEIYEAEWPLDAERPLALNDRRLFREGEKESESRVAEKNQDFFPKKELLKQLRQGESPKASSSFAWYTEDDPEYELLLPMLKNVLRSAKSRKRKK